MITSKLLSDHFTLPNKNIIAHLPENAIPFDFLINNNETLLVTIGDSWTWGDELINREHCFGRVLSQKLNSDWVNLSVTGCGNQYIEQLFTEFANLSTTLTYKKFIVIVTFTEVGRDFNSWFDQDVDYATWLRSNIKKSCDYNKFIEFLNARLATRMCAIANKIPNLTLLVATNFVNPLGLEEFENYLLPQSWLEHITNQSFENECNIVTSYIFDKLQTVLDMEWSLDAKMFNTWAIGAIQASTIRLDQLMSCKHICPHGHPDQIAHQLWADYVYKHINLKNLKF